MAIFPPVINTYMPVFVNGNYDYLNKATTKLYFGISNYNSLSDIGAVLVIINDQKSNKTLLKLWPNEMVMVPFTDIKLDTDRNNREDKYYIEITAAWLEENVTTHINTLAEFPTLLYMKVLLRFVDMAAFGSISGYSDPNGDVLLKWNTCNQSIKNSDWLSKNKLYFSEWSTVCLLRAIELPKILFLWTRGHLFKLDSSGTAYAYRLSSPIPELYGRMYFYDSRETETLRDYRIIIKQKTDNVIVDDSGKIECVDNYFYYKSKILLPSDIDTRYTVTFNYTTRNFYEGVAETDIIIDASNNLPTINNFNCTPDTENGRIKISFTSSENLIIAIVRSDITSNFTQWEELTQLNIESGAQQFADYTVECGVPYRYAILHIEKISGKSGGLIEYDIPVICNFDVAFLTNSSRALRLNLNELVSSVRRNYQEQKIDTIGGDFPFVTRGSANKYRTFGLQGTISYFSDKDESYKIILHPVEEQFQELDTEEKNNLFTNKEELYNGINGKQIQEAYNIENNISDSNNYYLERKFREKVMDYLYDNSPKLFRSKSEGNILVLLMDINFSPNNQLGGLIYDFSCTAVEIAEATIENFDKFSIQKVNKINVLSEEKYTYRINTGKVVGSVAD